MRYILIIASVILLASPLFGNSHKVENLFGWHTSSGVQLRKFGDNDTHPVYNGAVSYTHLTLPTILLV